METKGNSAIKSKTLGNLTENGMSFSGDLEAKQPDFNAKLG